MLNQVVGANSVTARRIARLTRRAALVAPVGCALALAACTTSSPGRPGGAGLGSHAPAAGALLSAPGRLVDRPVVSSGCGRRPGVRPGTTARLPVAVPPASAAGARTRTYWLHVPAGYHPARPAPLVLAFHGAEGTGIGMQAQTGLSALADRRGFLVAYPQGLAQPGSGGRVGWDASGPRDPQAHGIDDGLFASDVLTAVQARYCVDPDRIAATGFSNGAGLAGYLACVLAGRISAFAAVEAEFFAIAGGCWPAHPAAILDIHVLTDSAAPYAGVPARGSPGYYAPAVPAWLRAWALRDGCRGGPHRFLGWAAVTGQQWAGCDGSTAVAGYRIAAGGHAWPRTLGTTAGSAAIVDFFTAHPLRALTARWSPHRSTIVPALTAPALAVRSMRQFRLPTPGAQPFDVARGPGGTIWFTEFAAGKIGRISPAGVITEFRVPTPGAGPYQLAAGLDGAIWFTEYNAAKLGRVSPSGHVTEIIMPSWSAGGLGVTSGPRGMWVADPARDVDRITPGGQVIRSRLPAGSGIPVAIAAGPDGSAWVSESTGYFEHGQTLARLGGPAAPRTVTLADPASNVDALAAGPAGTLWFTDFGTGRIGELAANGRLRLFADPSPYEGLNDITRGPDGAMWFTSQAGLVGRITPAGAITQLALPTAGSAPDGIAAGPGRTIWIAETGADAIARITLP